MKLTILLILFIFLLILIFTHKDIEIKKEIKKHKQCEKCGSNDTKYGSRWIRGHNELCRQSYQDNGFYCNKCNHVTFETSLKDHLKTLPDWCKPYR